jgi:hypothetical protein
LLGVPDEAAVHALTREAARAGTAFAVNCEPDLGDQVTAVALAGAGARRLLHSLPLLLSEARRAADRLPAPTAGADHSPTH